MIYMGFDEQLEGIVSDVRAQKLQRLARYYEPKLRRRKPRFCVTVVLCLCPRQRAKRVDMARE